MLFLLSSSHSKGAHLATVRRRRRAALTSILAICTVCALLLTCVPTVAAEGSPTARQIVFGYMRLPGSDSPEFLTGVVAAVHEANRKGTAQGYNYTVETYTYPHCAYPAPMMMAVCDVSTAEMVASGLRDFIGNMSRFHAVLSPQYALSSLIITEAKRLKLPVIDPLTIAEEDFKAENLFLLSHHVETEVAVLARLMFTEHSCAHSGIFYTEGVPSVAEHITTVQSAFAAGGFTAPPVMSLATTADAVTAKAAEIREFFFGDSARMCFVLLTSGQGVLDLLMTVMGDPRYVPRERKMFAWGYAPKTVPRTTVASYARQKPILALAVADVYFTLPVPAATSAPPGIAHAFQGAIDLLRTDDPTFSSVYALAAPGGHEEFGNSTRLEGMDGFLAVSYAIELYGRVARHDLVSNVSRAWELFIDTAYTTPLIVGGDYPFARPLRSCLPKPFAQTCQCNVISRMVFIFTFDLISGRGVTPLSDVDPTSTAASMAFSSDLCVIKTDESIIPSSNLLLTTAATEDTPILPGGLSEKDLLDAFVTAHNAKGVGRPRRVVVQQYPASALTSVDATNAHMQMVADQYEPYVILSSDAPITNPDILTISSNSSFFALTDPPLKARPEWTENVLLLMPTYADYAHALASYYAAYKGSFTSLLVLVTSVEEAELAVKSFNTFQVKLSIADVFISRDANAWTSELMARVLLVSTSPRPFIFASFYQEPSILTSLTTQLLAGVNMGLIALDPSKLHITMAFAEPDRQSDRLVVNIPPGVDLIAPSVFGEWWLPSNPLQQMVRELGAPLDTVDFRASYYIKSANYIIANQLATLRTGTRTAAEVLYTARTASYGDIPLGPFSNDTCSDEIIAANEVDRTCQCNKGFRLFRVYSVNDLLAGRESASTGRYVYQMNTCGVQYLPYVEPVVPSLLIVGSDGNAATIAIAVVVPCAVVLIVLVLVVVFVCCGGRSNRHAPKDAELPFAVAFTDIQSSTTLWSRCPQVMSDAVDHHSMLIRRLIAKHRGYEVKTIGDSFMVAFRHVEDAVGFSVELQEVLYVDEWWPSEIDQHYREMIEGGVIGSDGADGGARALEALAGESSASLIHSGGGATMSPAQHALPSPQESHVIPFVNALHNHHAMMTPTISPRQAQGGAPNIALLHSGSTGPSTNNDAPHPPNAPLDLAEYDRLWRGIRVRVGVHYGFGEIRKDEVTHGYDYYGTLVNTAARVEGVGHGGQTLVTDAVVDALGDGYIVSQGWAQMSLGAQTLRGLDERVVLIQLLPSSLSGRRFPNLRLDVENAVENSDSNTSNALTSHNNNGGTGSSALQGLEALAVSLCQDAFGTARHNNASTIRGNKDANELSLTTTQTSAGALAAVAGGASETATITAAAGNSTAANHAASRAYVGELLYHYQYLTSVFSTSSEAWRKETLKHLATRWQVRGSHRKGSAGGNSGGAATEATRKMMQVALKAMLAHKNSMKAMARIQQQQQQQQQFMMMSGSTIGINSSPQFLGGMSSSVQQHSTNQQQQQRSYNYYNTNSSPANTNANNSSTTAMLHSMANGGHMSMNAVSAGMSMMMMPGGGGTVFSPQGSVGRVNSGVAPGAASVPQQAFGESILAVQRSPHMAFSTSVGAAPSLIPMGRANSDAMGGGGGVDVLLHSPAEAATSPGVATFGVSPAQ